MVVRKNEDDTLFPQGEIEQFVDQFLSAVCDTSRRHILALLSSDPEHKDAQPFECSVGDIAQSLGLAFSTTSEHLKQLLQLNLVVGRRDGKKTYYRIRNQDLVRTFHDMLASLEIHYHHHILPQASDEIE